MPCLCLSECSCVCLFECGVRVCLCVSNIKHKLISILTLTKIFKTLFLFFFLGIITFCCTHSMVICINVCVCTLYTFLYIIYINITRQLYDQKFVPCWNWSFSFTFCIWFGRFPNLLTTLKSSHNSLHYSVLYFQYFSGHLNCSIEV